MTAAAHKQAVLLTIPHTGTCFVVHLLAQAGYRQAQLHDRPHDRHHTLHTGHAVKATQIEPALRLARDMPLITTVRHPYRLEESWKRHGRSINEMIRCFDTLIHRIAPQATILAVDSPYRGNHLAGLSERLGVHLKTEWPIVHTQQSTYSVEWTDLDPSESVRALVDTHSEFFGTTYG